MQSLICRRPATLPFLRHHGSEASEASAERVLHPLNGGRPVYRILTASLAALLLLVCVLALFGTSAAADDKSDKDKNRVVYWPTPQEVVDEMLKMAKVTKDDIV